jgi:hypothetical protein
MFGPLAISPRPSDGLAAQRKECVNGAVPTAAFAIAYGQQTQRERRCHARRKRETMLMSAGLQFRIHNPSNLLSAIQHRVDGSAVTAEAQIPLVVRRRMVAKKPSR